MKTHLIGRKAVAHCSSHVSNIIRKKTIQPGALLALFLSLLLIAGPLTDAFIASVEAADLVALEYSEELAEQADEAPKSEPADEPDETLELITDDKPSEGEAESAVIDDVGASDEQGWVPEEAPELSLSEATQPAPDSIEVLTPGALVEPDTNAEPQEGIVPTSEPGIIMPLEVSDLWNLGHFQSNFIIKDSGNNTIPIDTGEFTYNTLYKYEVYFTAPQYIDETITKPAYNSESWLVYSLPEGVEILNSGDGIIYLGGDPTKQIGVYEIVSASQGNLIRVHFDDVSVYGTTITQTPGTNLLDHDYSNLSFMVGFDARFVKVQGGDEFLFGTDTTITVVDKDGGASVLKDDGRTPWASGYHSDTRTVDYTITVTANDGPITISHIVDTILRETGSGTASLEDIFSGKSLSSFVTNMAISNNGVPIPSSAYSVDWTADKKGFDIQFNSDVLVVEGQSLVITYTFNFNEIINVYGNASTSYLNYWINIKNVAEVYGSYQEPEEKIGEATVTTPVAGTFSEKRGTYDSDTNTITWTAHLGDYSRNINGWVITDTLGPGMDPNGSVSIKLFGADKAEITAPWTPVVNPSLTTNGFNLTIPAGGVNGKDVYRVEITYTVEVTSTSTIDETVVNDLRFVHGTIDGTVRGEVGIRRGEAAINKTGKFVLPGDPGFINDSDFSEGYVEWEIIYTIPAKPRGNGGEPLDMVVYFEDTSFTNAWQRLEEIGALDRRYFEITCSDPSFTPVISGPGRNMTLVQSQEQYTPHWALYFGADEKTNRWEQREASFSPFDDGADLIVKYRVPLDLLVMVGSTQVKLGDYMKSVPNSLSTDYRPTMINSAWMYYIIDGSTQYRYHEPWLYWPVHKFASVVGDRIDYTVWVRMADLSAANGMFVDSFDGSILEYVPFTFRASGIQGAYCGPYAPGVIPVVDLLQQNGISSDGCTLSYNIFDMNLYWNGSQASYTGLPPTGVENFPHARYDPATSPSWLGDWITVVKYSLKLKEGVELGEYEVTNTASVGKFSSTHTGSVGAKPVTKTILVNAGGTATAEIVINPLGQKVLGSEASSGVYRSEDVMSSNLAYISGTLQFWTRDKLVPGSPWTQVTPVLAAHSEEEEAVAWTYTIIDAQRLNFWFPDEEPVRITYRLRGLATQDETFTNTITVMSYEAQDSLEGFEVGDTEGKADLEVLDLLIAKLDSETGEPIPEAVDFALYIDMHYSNFSAETIAQAEAHGYPSSFILGDTIFYYVEDGTTEEGFLSFHKELYSQFPNLVYALYEREAPPGYEGPEIDSPLEEHLTLFYFQYPDLTTELKFTSLGFELYDSNGVVEVFNTPEEIIEPDSTSWTPVVAKSAVGKDMSANQFGFALYASDVSGLKGTLLDSATNGSAGSFSTVSFGVITYDEVDTHYYLVEESTLSGDGWTTSTQSYLIRVVVSDGGEGSLITTATYWDGTLWQSYSISALEFVNTYEADSTSITIEGTKKVDGAADPASFNKEFTFYALQVDEVGQAQYTGSAERLMGSANVTGFGSFTIQIDGLEQSQSPYYFAVFEDTTEDGVEGWSYSQNVFWITVSINQSLAGATEAIITSISDGEETVQSISFTNSLALVISCEVAKDTIKRTSAAFVSLPNQEGFNNVGRLDERYRYDIDYRSTSNVSADEYVVDDPLECVRLDQVRVEELWTAITWGDVDGLFNVWYKTNMTSDSTLYSLATANPAVSSPAYPNTGFRLWAQNLSATTRHHLTVADLGLSPGEYITALRFEYGAVLVGFTSMNYSRYNLNGNQSVTPITPMSSSAEAHGNGSLEPKLLTAQNAERVQVTPKMLLEQILPSWPEEHAVTALAGAAAPNTIDWTPVAGQPHFSAGAASAEGLKPVSYLVSALRPMDDEQIASSVTSRIARGDLRDHDQDAVVTLVIPTFEGGATENILPEVATESTFVNNAQKHGWNLRAGGTMPGYTYDANRNAWLPTTGDSLMPLVYAFAISLCIALMLLLAAFVLRRRSAHCTKKRIASAARKPQGITRFSVILLAVTMSMGLFTTQAFAAPGDEEEVTENVTVEYHYYEGEENQLDIPQTITQFGREYRLLGVSEPILESTLPDTRTYSYRINGTLSLADLELIEGIEGIALTPVEIAVERDVDKTEVIDGLPNNDVDYLPYSKEFEISSASSANAVTLDELSRAGVTYKITGYDEYGLPSSYEATIVYRGVESFLETAYYLADVTYYRDEVVGETPQYVVVATYEPTEESQEAASPEPLEEELLVTEPEPEEPLLTGEDVIPSPDEVLEQLIDQGVQTMNIGGQEVPLWGATHPHVWTLADLIMSIIGVVIAVLTVVRLMVGQRRLNKESNLTVGTQEDAPAASHASVVAMRADQTHASQIELGKTLWFVATLVLGVGGIVLFLLTQNTSNLMVLFNSTTFLFALILALVIVCHLFVFKSRRSKLG
ncbi:MAG: hypothetical protein FWD27_03055 [Coriobacteriia bacterium]|nr:hypothetical protein [Coriobacteriia bacterium]